MANLTGQYDVVVEVGLGLLNGVMGAVHSNQDPDYPTMPHGIRLFLDDTPRETDPVPPSERTGVRSWVEVQASVPTLSLPADTLVVSPDPGLPTQPRLTRPVGGTPRPGGEAPDVADTGGEAGLRWPPRWPGGGLPFPFGPRVTARVRIRAWVQDPTDPPLPSFIHGDVVVTSALVRSDVPNVGTFVTVDRTHGPTVAFEPSPGSAVSAEQAQLVATLVRNFIRGDTEPATFRVPLPQGVRRLDYRLAPEAHRPSVLLMLALDSTPGSGASASVTPGLLADERGFAVGIGRDHIVRKLGANLFVGLQPEYSYSKYGVSASVRPDWAGATFELEAGRIVFSLHGDGDISWWGVDDHFTFSVRQAFGLWLSGGALEPVPLGDPEVSLQDVAVGEGYLEGKARDTIRAERDAALAAHAAELRDSFDVARQIETILSTVSPDPADVQLTDVTIRPDGVVVQGRIGLGASGPVVASQAGRGGFNDAVASWVPGGTVDRYVWERWPSKTPLVRVETERFVTEAIPTRPLGGLCLRVEGTRVTAGGTVVPVAGSACFPFLPVLGPVDGLDMAGDRPLLPLTEPDGEGGTRVIGEYDPWALGRVPAGGHSPLLVHFAEDGEEGARSLMAALGERHGVVPIVVVRAGAMATSPELDDPPLVVEDVDGRWARAFRVDGPPATVLIGPRGDEAWRSGKAPAARELRAALKEHGGGGGEPTLMAQGPGTRANRRPPDVTLAAPDGAELSLRRLAGRPIVVRFWTGRSQTSVASLDELVAAHDAGTTVVAVGDGETAEAVDGIVGAREYPFLVVGDPDRRISRAFGVWCWPTTVWIRPDQRVEAVDLGAVVAAGPREGPEQAG